MAAADNRVLLIAFHFPPVVGTSGVHRTYALARYLSEAGWQPVVLTVNLRAYQSTGPDLLKLLPSDTIVHRSFALDSARHLSIFGKYPDFMAWPDRWVSWFPAGVIAALRLIRRYKPRAIWSTYPVPTSHLIALAASKLTCIPWIADFRDSMTEDDYPKNKRQKKIFQWIERKTVANASRVTFTAPGTLGMYASRYPEIAGDKWSLILNGFDEDIFQKAESIPFERDSDKTIMLHSGVIYPKERDPKYLFRAIANLRNSGVLADDTFELRLRATGHDAHFLPMLNELGIDKMVRLLPKIEYEIALAEMMNVDGLVLMQSASCNHQIPAKLYEYVRANRPIFALTDARGDTAQLMRNIGSGCIVPLDCQTSIESQLPQFLRQLTDERNVLSATNIDRFSRRSQAFNTAELLFKITGRSGHT